MEDEFRQHNPANVEETTSVLLVVLAAGHGGVSLWKRLLGLQVEAANKPLVICGDPPADSLDELTELVEDPW